MRLAIGFVLLAVVSVGWGVPKASLFDSLQNLYPDSDAATGAKSMELDVARGGTAAVHILLKDVSVDSSVDVWLMESNERVAAQWYRLVDVPVEKNTGLGGFIERKDNENAHVIRRAPFRTYDAMEPIRLPMVAKSATTALRLHVPMALSADPGARRFVIRVSCGEQAMELPLTVVVHKAAIPPAGRESLPYTNWFSLHQMASRHKLMPWSEEHWEMIGQYARLMHHGRQNTFWVTWGDVFSREKTGLVLNRERLRRIVQVFSEAGLYYIEGGHVAGRHKGEWSATYFDVSVGGPRATSEEGNADLAKACKQLMEEIEKNNWRARWIQHVTDEPTAENATDYRILTGMVRKYMPGLPILDATMNTAMAGSVDFWCPQAQEYQKHRDVFVTQQLLGDKVWFYTCCLPGGPWTNRLLDMELLRPAYFGWGAALYDLDGFLHWGLNHYGSGQDPFQQSVIPHSGDTHLPGGDTHIVYPGPTGPWSSLRLEAQREGFEDYELLKMLKAKDRNKAEEIIRRTFRGFDDFSKDTKTFRGARKALLESL